VIGRSNSPTRITQPSQSRSGQINASSIQGSPFGAGSLPSSVVVDPANRFAYVANSGGKISAYGLGSTGVLRSFPVRHSPQEVSRFPWPSRDWLKLQPKDCGKRGSSTAYRDNSLTGGEHGLGHLSAPIYTQLNGLLLIFSHLLATGLPNLIRGCFGFS
jgi:hypothetical protein